MRTFDQYINEAEVDETIKHRPGVWSKENSASDNLDNELDMIEDSNLREFIESYLDEAVPEYFWSVAGAKNDIHHPKQDTGDGGLIRHTRMCCAVALELLQNDLFKEVRDKRNELIAALICHDSIKNGRENAKYAQDHPTWAGNNIKNFFSKRYKGDKGGKLSSQVDFIADCVSKHMGPNYMWRKPYPLTKAEQAAGKRPGKILPAPDNPYASFVHLCDYIASRQFVGDLNKYSDKYYSSNRESTRKEAEKEAAYQERHAQRQSEREAEAEAISHS